MTNWLPEPGAPLPHYVSDAPFDARSVAAMTAEQERVYAASQLKLMWWKFRKHRVALISAVFLAVMYLVLLAGIWMDPYGLHPWVQEQRLPSKCSGTNQDTYGPIRVAADLRPGDELTG